MKILIAAALFFTGSSFAQAPPQAASHAGKRPFTFEDMMALKRVSEPLEQARHEWRAEN